MTEQKERQAFVDAALGYIGTPYAHMGRIKGPQGGVDCATLLICAAQDADLLGKFDLSFYPQDWHLHRGGERYLGIIQQLCGEVAFPALPGDIVLWKFGRSFSHAAIVIKWPQIVHAYVGRPCCLDDAEKNQLLRFIGEAGPDQNKPRPTKLLSRWRR